MAKKRGGGFVSRMARFLVMQHLLVNHLFLAMIFLTANVDSTAPADPLAQPAVHSLAVGSCTAWGGLLTIAWWGVVRLIVLAGILLVVRLIPRGKKPILRELRLTVEAIAQILGGGDKQ